MGTYLTRLKEIKESENFNHSLITEVPKVPKPPLNEIENRKKFNSSLITEVPKVPKPPSDTFDTSSQDVNKKN